MKESELLEQVKNYLTYEMNAGKLWFTRLNSGKAFVKRGDKYYAIQLSEEGTADLMVIKKAYWGESKVIFLECKSATGKQTPEQVAFQILVEMQGCEYHVVRELEEVINILGGKE